MAQRSSGRGSAGTRGSGERSPGRGRTPVDHHEVEWQFDAADLESAEAWLCQHSSGSGLVIEPESEEKITDTYYDAGTGASTGPVTRCASARPGAPPRRR